MTQFFALWSIVFMMGFVVTFDNIHHKGQFKRVLSSLTLLSSDEVDQMRAIWSSCRDD
jgi:hypothetical protein